MAEQEQNLTQLQQTIQQLKTELDTIKKLVSNPSPISADAYQPLLGNSTATNQILELPISRVIDLYRECPEILEAYAQRATIDKKHFSLDGDNNDQPLTFQVNPNGNFWVIQLQSQGSYLFPRPNDTKRISRLSLLDKIFKLNARSNELEAEFDVALPAKLAVIKLQTNWQLEKKGELSYAQIPLHYQWQQELTSIRQQQEEIVQQSNALAEQNEKLKQDLVTQYPGLNRELNDFRKKNLVEFKRLKLIAQNQQETINYLLNLTKHLEHKIEINHKYTEEIIKLFENEQEITNKKNELLSHFFNIKEMLEEESKKLSKPQNNKQEVSLTELNLDEDICTTEDFLNPFYSEVISYFNGNSITWFSSQIQQQTLLKVEIKRNFMFNKTIDIGGNIVTQITPKITQLELNEWGTLLIYQAGDKFWAIPDQTQSKWKRAITDSLFIGNGQTLVRPAEVESVGNNLWQLVEKGEFS